MNSFFIKPKLYYGSDALESINNVNFQNVCIATDKFMIESKMINKLCDILDSKNIKYHIFDEITSDPTMDTVEKGLSHIVNLKPDALIAFGGGSVIDAAKAIMYFCIQLKKKFIEESQIVKPYFIAIPTTAGTGSEVSRFSVITDIKNNIKIPITDDLMIPDEAILDPLLTSSVPKSITAATGMDILTHAIESYISTNSNVFSELYSLNAIKLVCNNLISCYNDLCNLELRSNLQIASYLAGVAFNSSGLGITHSLAHAVGSNFHIPHGLANAIILPYIIEFNGTNKLVANKYINILNIMGVKNSTVENSSTMLKLVIEEINKYLNIPSKLNELNIKKGEFYSLISSLTKSAYEDVCTYTNPVKVNLESLENLFKSIY